MAAESEPAPPSDRGKRKRSRARTGDDEEAAAASASAASEKALSEASSAASSPDRWPYIQRVVKGHDSCGGEILEPFIKIDPAIVDAHEKLKLKYYAKRERQLKLATMDQHVPHSCFLDQELFPDRESATKTVLEAAKTVLGLSSYIDEKLLTRCSGFLIDWNEESKAGTVLTSAHLICLKSPSLDEWLDTKVYAPDAKVYVHLPDKNDTTIVAHLLHYHEHYNLALFKINMDQSAQIPSCFTEVKHGQELFVLGRDENMYLNIDHGSVLYMDPSDFELYHYMFINLGINKHGLGGPVIDCNGKIAGMANLTLRMGFIPSSIILKCLDMWKKFHCVPRLHIGMKFSSIKFLDPAHVDTISRKCNVDAGLIVIEVSEGSIAEKLGVRIGDIIECMNGECIATTIELENLLMRICEDHLDKRRGIGSNVDVPVVIFHTRKGSRHTINLTVKVSDNVEVIATGTYPVSTRDCALVFADDVGPGQDAH
ncbi:uncharacterized protein LOC133885107 isoform X3 [Phragmites australis]|uniref:uncharacterized protein LOC133885107 isoform X3 n=1 Tax=Phragmites australis TaxID=29695 RepID=UPI002D78E753|nr:uncharacterized protein LOC133885107 isoform X3 [Phragmites australis]